MPPDGGVSSGLIRPPAPYTRARQRGKGLLARLAHPYAQAMKTVFSIWMGLVVVGLLLMFLVVFAGR